MIERENERVSLVQPVELDSSSGRREVRVSDLSTGGCYVDSISPVQPNEIVGLTFVLSGAPEEKIVGTVVYVHEGIGFGVRFNDMSEQQEAMVKELIVRNGGSA